MKRIMVVLLISAVAIGWSALESRASGVPFRDPTRIIAPDGKPYSQEYTLRQFRVAVNSIPYYLSAYLDSGDLLVLQDIREAVTAVGLYVNLIGKSAQTDLEKEIFAKLQVGLQKLNTSVERSLRAVTEFRRARLVYGHRSARLVQWMDSETDRLLATGSPEGQNSEVMRLLSDVRLGVLQSVFLCRVSPWGAMPDPQRSKAIETWELTVRKAEQLSAVATTPAEKELAQSLIAGLNNVRGLARDLLTQTDELNQSWEQALSSAESLASLINPLFTENKATGVPSDKGPK